MTMKEQDITRIKNITQIARRLARINLGKKYIDELSFSEYLSPCKQNLFLEQYHYFYCLQSEKNVLQQPEN